MEQPLDELINEGINTKKLTSKQRKQRIFNNIKKDKIFRKIENLDNKKKFS